MKREKRIFCSMTLFLVSFFSSFQFVQAQSNIYNAHGWQLLDYRTDSVFGAGINRAYAELLKGKKAHPVIVAVIDMGVDTAHEDLVGHIWTNTKEIPGTELTMIITDTWMIFTDGISLEVKMVKILM
ncbi:MAG: hypothetical protein WDM78_04155 [Puia sp.]